MKTDRISGLLGLVLALLIIYFGTRDLPFGTLSKPGSGFFPLILGSLLGIFSLFFLIRNWAKKGARRVKERVSPAGKKRVVLTFAVLLIYNLLLESMGFLVCTFLLIFFMLKTVCRQRWSYTLLGSLLTTAVSYIVFQKLLQAQLPQGILSVFGLR